MFRLLVAAVVATAGVQVANPVPVPHDARSVLAPLTPGATPVGFRTFAIVDPARARPLAVQVWYPASGCNAPLTFRDYVFADPPEAREPLDRGRRLINERARLAGAVGPIQHDTWDTLLNLRMLACRDADIRPGPHPVLVGLFNNGVWPLQAEYLASHGYAVAVVAARGSALTGPRDDWPRQVALHLLDQIRDMQVAVAHLPSVGPFDVSSLGVLGGSDSGLPFALQSMNADAVVMQDSGLFGEGLGSDAVRLLPSWRPQALRSAVLILERSSQVSQNTRIADLEAMQHVSRTRVTLAGAYAGHEDVTSAGYALRALSGTAEATEVSHIRAFTASLRAMHTFFDAYVRADPTARNTLDTGELVPSSVGSVQRYAATARPTVTGPRPSAAASGPTAEAASTSGLPYGAHHVGFRLVSAQASGSRTLRIHVWYPAATAGPPMRIRDHLDGTRGPEAIADIRALTTQLFGPVPDGSLETLLDSQLRASAKAAPLAGRHRLIVTTLRAPSTAHSNEVLASHGYVVAAVESAQLAKTEWGAAAREGQLVDRLRRDLDVTIHRLRRESFVAPGPVGAFGFSGAGLAPLALAATSHEVGALALLESGWHGPSGSSLANIPGFRLDAIKAPMLFVWSDALSKAAPQMRDIGAMTNHRTIARATAYGISHWDFASEGYLAAADGHWRAADRVRVRRIFEETNTLLVAFFDHHLRGHSGPLPTLPTLAIQEHPTNPAATITGFWRGTARAAHTRDVPQTAQVAFDIRSLPAGVGLYMTLPRLHAWRMPVGYLTAQADGSWSITDWKLTLRRSGATLTGTLGDPRVTFVLHQSDSLPQETPSPTYPAGPAPAWTYDVGAPLWASVASADGIVYAADTQGFVHAVNATDGRAVWRVGAGNPIYGAPLVTADALFVFDDGGVLRRMNRTNGGQQWRSELGSDPAPRVLPASDIFTFDFHAPTPVLHRGLLYVASSQGTVHAVDAATGQTTWKVDVGAKVRASLAVSTSSVFVPTLSGEVVALHRTDGTVRWRFQATGPVTSAPVIAGNLLLVASRGSWLSAIDGRTGDPVWSRYDWFSWIESTGIVRGDTYIVGSSDLRAVRAIDIPTGKTLWESDVLGWAWGTPAVDRELVYIGVAGPQSYVTKHAAGLVAINRRTGTVRWRRAVPSEAASFVSGYPGSVGIVGDVLVAPNVAGRLEGYRLSTPRQ